jgi:LacI family transcriptional regulator
VPKSTPTRKRTTLREVAELTGLSPAGVSYALRGQRVSAETSARVQEVAERIGFRTDPIARALRGGRTNLIGVVGGSLSDYWHQEFVSNLAGHLGSAGLHMLLADPQGDAEAEIELAHSLVAQRVDGLIVLPVDPANGAWRQLVAEVPTVSVNAPLPAPASSIRFASERGIALVQRHLRALGHERILVLSPGVHPIPRRRGQRVSACGFAPADGRRAALRALRRSPRPTAVMALTDSLAHGAYEACRELGLRIPDDVAVTGFDDHPVSRLLDPPLTAVGWDTPGAAAAAAELLGRAMDGHRRTARLVQAPHLSVRGSTSPSRPT